ncbi:MAG: hypothetical protein RL077_1862, partial [Verrucomicrobiota bacterium]
MLAIESCSNSNARPDAIAEDPALATGAPSIRIVEYFG